MLRGIVLVPALVLGLGASAFAQTAEVEPNNDPTHATPIALGQSGTGTLEFGSNEDFDYWVVTANAGEMIYVDVDANEFGSPTDPALTLFASDGATSLASNGAWDGLDPHLEYRAATSGKYYVYVTTSYGSQGPQHYAINFFKVSCPTADDAEPNDTTTTAKTISSGARVHGVACPANDVDWFKFNATAGATVTIQIDTVGRERPPFGCACGIYAWMRLIGPDGQTIAQTTENTNPVRIEQTLTAGGTYYIRATMWPGGIRYPYTLRFDVQGAGGAGNGHGKGDPPAARADGLGHPWSVIADPTGDFIVTDPDGNRIWWVTPDGRKQVITNAVPSPQRLAWDMFGNLLITSAHAVYQLKPTGAVSPWFVRDGIADAAMAPDGTLWMAAANTLLHVTPSGVVIEQLGIAGMQSGPNVLAIGSAGDVFFTDDGAAGGTTVYRLVNKQPLKLFSVSWRASDLVLDDDGQLYLTSGDLSGATTGVYRYSQGGTALDNPLAGQVPAPSGLAFARDANGKMLQRLFVLDWNNGRLMELNAAGVPKSGAPVGFPNVAQVAADLLKSGSVLNAGQRQALDAIGNRNGHFDVGDFRAFLIQTTTIAAARRRP